MVGMKLLLSLTVISLAVGGPLTGGEVKRIDTPEQLELDLCPTCVSLLGQTINQLLNIVLNTGVIGSCEQICTKLDNSLEQVACTLICADVGLKGFIWAIHKADLDPIYMCELVSICPTHDGGKATIQKLVTDPSSGPPGTVFDIAVGFQVMNQTSTGQIFVRVDCPGGVPVIGSQVNEGFTPGDYSLGLKVDSARISHQEPFIPGTYNVTVEICNGSCGSDHEWAQVLSEEHSSFVIEDSN